MVGMGPPIPSYQGIIVYQSEMMLKRKRGTPLGVPRCEFLCHGQLHREGIHPLAALGPDATPMAQDNALSDGQP